MERTYIAIDLKSFYASVECVERGLDPLTAKLVVADESRTEKTICLAATPALKALGIHGRARLFEVLSQIPRDEFIIAPPRMAKYMEVSNKIFEIYCKYISPNDIHVYSIDEVFMDVTSYLKSFNLSAEELARKMIRDVLEQTGVTATAGIGTNLYLAKIAMDIVAKHLPADIFGARIAELNEQTYREKLWTHKPLTDFWRIGPGYARSLTKLGIYTMGDLAKYSISGSEKLYKVFGINAELLIDHAWGWEPTLISDIKKHRTSNHSLCSGQVLHEPASFDQTRLIVNEMSDQLALDLCEKNASTSQIVLSIGYDTSNLMRGFSGEIDADRYGRSVPKNAHGSINLGCQTVSARLISTKTLELFDRIIDKNLLVRRISLAANHVKKYNIDNFKTGQIDLFSNFDSELENEKKAKRLQDTELRIKKRYGKNSILKAMNFEKGATMRERNEQVGGHKA